MNPGIFEELLPQEISERLLISSVSVGEVYRMHLDGREKVKGKDSQDEGRNKYFIVLGHDLKGNALGFVLIDSEINPALPLKRKQLHYPLLAEKYAFLNGKNRFVDCSDLKEISAERFRELFSKDKVKGVIEEDDLILIREAVISYEDVSPKLLKRFGLIQSDNNINESDITD